jgi:hypothetical protein
LRILSIQRSTIYLSSFNARWRTWRSSSHRGAENHAYGEYVGTRTGGSRSYFKGGGIPDASSVQADRLAIPAVPRGLAVIPTPEAGEARLTIDRNAGAKRTVVVNWPALRISAEKA